MLNCDWSNSDQSSLSFSEILNGLQNIPDIHKIGINTRHFPTKSTVQKTENCSNCNSYQINIFTLQWHFETFYFIFNMMSQILNKSFKIYSFYRYIVSSSSPGLISPLISHDHHQSSKACS